jgi:hypothetical protein
VNAHTIYPYVHSFSNVPNKDAVLRAIKIPDVKPSDIPPNSNFSLVAGNSLLVMTKLVASNCVTQVTSRRSMVLMRKSLLKIHLPANGMQS